MKKYLLTGISVFALGVTGAHADNVAMIEQASGNGAAIIQTEDNNLAFIAQSGDGNEAQITQEGGNNIAGVIQAYDDDVVSIVQDGDDLEIYIDQGGAGANYADIRGNVNGYAVQDGSGNYVDAEFNGPNVVSIFESNQTGNDNSVIAATNDLADNTAIYNVQDGIGHDATIDVQGANNTIHNFQASTTSSGAYYTVLGSDNLAVVWQEGDVAQYADIVQNGSSNGALIYQGVSGVSVGDLPPLPTPPAL